MWQQNKLMAKTLINMRKTMGMQKYFYYVLRKKKTPNGRRQRSCIRFFDFHQQYQGRICAFTMTKPFMKYTPIHIKRVVPNSMLYHTGKFCTIPLDVHMWRMCRSSITIIGNAIIFTLENMVRSYNRSCRCVRR